MKYSQFFHLFLIFWKNTLPSCKNLSPKKKTLQGTSQRIIYKHPRDIQTMLIWIFLAKFSSNVFDASVLPWLNPGLI